MQLSPTLTDILTAGILAPSADNHHHLRFEPTKDGVRVWSEPGRMHHLTGYKRTLDLISLGAVIENIALQAGSHQLQADIELLPGPSEDLIAEVSFSETEASADPLFKQIPQRHTNRKFFTGPKAAPEALSSISSTFDAIPECSLFWLDTPALRRKALPLIRQAEGARFRHKILHAEMFDNIRFDVPWHSSCDEGLPPGALEVERSLRPIFKLLRHWPIMRILNGLGTYRMLGWRAGDLPCRLSPHLGLIVLDDLTDKTQLNTGRLIEKLWLTATTHELAMQPMPASALYAQDSASNPTISSPLHSALAKGYQAFCQDKIPFFLFRMGHSQPPEIQSSRPPLQNYLNPSS